MNGEKRGRQEGFDGPSLHSGLADPPFGRWGWAGTPVRVSTEFQVLTAAAPSSFFLGGGAPGCSRDRLTPGGAGSSTHTSLTSTSSSLHSRPGQAAFSRGWGQGLLHLTLINSFLPAFRQGGNWGTEKVGTPGNFSILTGTDMSLGGDAPFPSLQEGLISPSPSPRTLLPCLQPPGLLTLFSIRLYEAILFLKCSKVFRLHKLKGVCFHQNICHII